MAGPVVEITAPAAFAGPSIPVEGTVDTVADAPAAVQVDFEQDGVRTTVFTGAVSGPLATTITRDSAAGLKIQ